MSEVKSKPRYFSVSGQKIASVKIDGKLYPLYSAFDVERTTKDTPADAVRFVRRSFEEAFPNVSEEDMNKLMTKITKKYQVKMEKNQGSKKKTKSKKEEEKPKKSKKSVEEVPMKKSKKSKAGEGTMKQISGYTLFHSLVRKEIERIEETKQKRPNTTILWTPTPDEKKQKWEEIRAMASEGLKITGNTLEKIVRKWAKESTVGAN